MQKPIVKRILRCCALLLGVVFLFFLGGVLFLFSCFQYSPSMFSAENPYNSFTPQKSSQQLSFIQEGKTYEYNKDIVNILLLGVDKTTTRDTELSNTGHQADTIVLLSLNTKTGHVDLVNISRDIRAPINHFDFNGEYAYTEKGPLCNAHSFGDGGITSGQMMQGAVSTLMYGIPINAYASISIDAIAPAVDSLGGVPVEVSFDFQVIFDKAEGEEKLLDGKEAEMYVRDRSLPGMSGNNVHRVLRQIQFAQSFLQVIKTKIKENPFFALQFYKTVVPYLSTNLNHKELIFLGKTMLDNSEMDIHYIKTYEQEEAIYADETNLKSLVKNLYFIPTKS